MRESLLYEISVKLLEIETIKRQPDFGNAVSLERLRCLFDDVSSQHYSNALCGEPDIRAWMLKLARELAKYYCHEKAL